MHSLIGIKLSKAKKSLLWTLILCSCWSCRHGEGHEMNANRAKAAKETSKNMNRIENLDGVHGKVFRVDPARQRFQLLTETAFDPKTREGKSRHTIHWTDRTRFIKVKKQHNLKGIDGQVLAHFQQLRDEDAKAAAAGQKLEVKYLTILAADEDATGLKRDAHNLIAPLKPDSEDARFRGGTAMLEGNPVQVHVGFGNRAEVDIRSVASAEEFSRGFWKVELHGVRQEEGRFVVDTMEIFPRVDPRDVDDPDLPRILVVGDSISMNYHAAAKEALKGKANYYRIDGNGGDSARGVACMDLWLGDYTQPGLHWDVIQFNHGLHDLKQEYDEETGKYGAYQVPVEEYKANLEKEIQIMKKTGAILVWCSTTPVPRDYFGRWPDGTFGRRAAAVNRYNQAAREVIEKHPDIRINDLNHFISESEAFDQWRQQKDVHFWGQNLQKLVGQAVADRLIKVINESKKQ